MAVYSIKIGSAADEMYDLQAVSGMQLGDGPLRAGHDFAIQFDGDAISLHSELPNELIQRGRLRARLHIAIDNEFHARNVLHCAIRIHRIREQIARTLRNSG